MLFIVLDELQQLTEQIDKACRCSVRMSEPQSNETMHEILTSDRHTIRNVIQPAEQTIFRMTVVRRIFNENYFCPDLPEPRRIFLSKVSVWRNIIATR